jgi:glycoprotein endo-alpha-1,2-mannosidase
LFPKTTDEVPAIPKDIMVGAYYYPWYSDDFHRGDGYVRDKLIPRHQPTLGEYDDTKHKVVAQHLAWSRQANINLWLTSWWGRGRREDITISEVIMKHEDLGDHQIALLYESTSRVRQDEGWTTQRVASDMNHICRTYFQNDNYYKIDGKPVLAMYLTRSLHENDVLGKVTQIMRDTAKEVCKTEIYIIGDQVWGNAPNPSEDYPPFDYLDALTNYDLYGNTDDSTSTRKRSAHASQGTVDRYYKQQADWRARAIANNVNYIPAVSPGYNDRGVRRSKDNLALSRRLEKDSEPGTLFAAQLQQARYLVDSGAGNLLLVNSFNEWHEDTQIEPCDGEPTNVPYDLTNGTVYEGYGELYLDILRAGTACDSNCQHAVFVDKNPPSPEAYPLGNCVGDCKADNQCAEGLYCFKRDPNTAVPGCSGGEKDNSRTDYCTRRLTGTLFVHPVRSPTKVYPLGLCVGHCKNDDDCVEGLHCFKHDKNTDVPGCIGGEEDGSETDYCTSADAFRVGVAERDLLRAAGDGHMYAPWNRNCWQSGDRLPGFGGWADKGGDSIEACADLCKKKNDDVPCDVIEFGPTWGCFKCTDGLAELDLRYQGENKYNMKTYKRVEGNSCPNLSDRKGSIDPCTCNSLVKSKRIKLPAARKDVFACVLPDYSGTDCTDAYDCDLDSKCACVKADDYPFKCNQKTCIPDAGAAPGQSCYTSKQCASDSDCLHVSGDSNKGYCSKKDVVAIGAYTKWNRNCWETGDRPQDLGGGDTFEDCAEKCKDFNNDVPCDVIEFGPNWGCFKCTDGLAESDLALQGKSKYNMKVYKKSASVSTGGEL